MPDEIKTTGPDWQLLAREQSKIIERLGEALTDLCRKTNHCWASRTDGTIVVEPIIRHYPLGG